MVERFPNDLARLDVKLASEHQLIARNADIGAARAAFFPRISLTGFLGSASPELSGLFEARSRAWSFSPVVSIPIFTGGRNKANLDLTRNWARTDLVTDQGGIHVRPTGA